MTTLYGTFKVLMGKNWPKLKRNFLANLQRGFSGLGGWAWRVATGVVVEARRPRQSNSTTPIRSVRSRSNGSKCQRLDGHGHARVTTSPCCSLPSAATGTNAASAHAHGTAHLPPRLGNPPTPRRLQLLEMALAGAAALPRLWALLLPFLAVATCLDVPSHGNNALRSNDALVRNKQLLLTFWWSELGLLLPV